MRKTIFSLLVLTMFTFSANSAFAFGFVDPSALVQRTVEFLKTTQNRVEQATHFKKVVDWAKEFNSFKNDFQKYQNQFDRMYKNISRGTYTSAFNVANWDWKKLDEHIIKSYRAWDRAWYDAQMVIIRTGRMYQENPLYKRFVDEMDVINKEIMMIEEEESKFLTDSNDRIKELMDERDKTQKLIESIAVGDFASGENQQIAMQAAQGRMAGLTLQLNLEEAQKKNAEASYRKRKEHEANKAAQKQAELSAENIAKGGDVAQEIADLDAWASRVKACAMDSKSDACKAAR